MAVVHSPRAMLTSDTLSVFLKAASERPFSWGSHDCLMWLADWIVVARGIDPAADWRGRYRSAFAAARILKRRGGAIGHLDACLRPFGIARTETAARGDIAVLVAPEGKMGGIVLGRSVAVVGEAGLRVRRLPIVAAWRV